MRQGYLQSGINEHQGNFKGLVTCMCMSCGVRFDRAGQEVLQKSSQVKEFTYITQKKIIDACNKRDLSLLKPKSESDWIFMRANLCDECLHGFRKPKANIEADDNYNVIKSH